MKFFQQLHIDMKLHDDALIKELDLIIEHWQKTAEKDYISEQKEAEDMLAMALDSKITCLFEMHSETSLDNLLSPSPPTAFPYASLLLRLIPLDLSIPIASLQNQIAQGNAHAMTTLGYYYHIGHHLKKDLSQAQNYYSMAADKGDFIAYNNLGILYSTFNTSMFDGPKAYDAFAHAASYGQNIPLMNQAYCLAYGLGVSKDIYTSFSLCKEAALGHDQLAYVCLGNMYEYGKGTPIDPDQALIWYQRSVKHDSPYGHLALGVFLKEHPSYSADFQEILSHYQFAANSNLVEAWYQFALLYTEGLYSPFDAEATFFWFQKAAQAGHLDAQNYLGEIYLYGIGTEADPIRALNWFEKAASHGHLLAQMNLGELYENGKDIFRSHTLSFYWFYQAALQKSPEALFKIAYYYEHGKGIHQDQNMALYFYEASANLDFALAQTSLALFYSEPNKGNDPSLSFSWAKRAASKGYPLAQYLLGNYYNEGYGCHQNLEKAFFWYWSSANQSFTAAKTATAQCYESGRGTEKNLDKAIHWYTEAVNSDTPDAFAQNRLAYFYEKGVVLEQLPIEAFRLYRLAANQDYIPAIMNLGRFYSQGIGTQKDFSLAKSCYERAALMNDVEACSILGHYYFKGIGCNPNEEKAFFWTHLASEKGNAEAQNNLAFFYEKGIGTEVNLENALRWYQRSADQAHISAQLNLGRLYSRSDYYSPQMAFYWYKKAAIKNSPYASYSLGWCYAEGFGIDSAPSKAFYWYQKSASEDFPAGLFGLAWCYHEGFGTKQDLYLAFDCMERAAHKGYAEAQLHLSHYYHEGHGTDIDLAKSFHWCHEAAKQSNLSACKRLAYYHQHGIGTPINLSQASYWQDIAKRLSQNDIS